MKSVLRNTAILSSSSIVSIGCGLLVTKAYAVLIGPGGVGFMGLLQSLVGLAGLLAGIGISSGLVRLGARALERDASREVAALRRASWLLFWILGSLVAAILMLFRVSLSSWILGGPEYEWSVVFMGLALLLTLAAELQIGTLNTYHRVSALARVNVLKSVLGAAASLAIVLTWGVAGVPAAIVANTAVGWAVSRILLWRAVGRPSARPTREEVRNALAQLTRFLGPYTAGLLVSRGVLLVLPVLVLHELGRDDVGFFRAAMLVSMSYLGFLMTAMSQDYFPRVSAAAENRERLVELVNQQHRLVMLVAVPVILAALALAPHIVPLIYSAEFGPTADILEWQLIGDIFRFSSWTMAFVILARSKTSTYFLTQLVGGALLFLSSWGAMRWFGLGGLGLGFLVTYVLYFGFVWYIIRREIGLVWSAENRFLLAYAVGAALLVQAMDLVGLENWRTPVALVLATIAATTSSFRIWKEFRGLGHVRA